MRQGRKQKVSMTHTNYNSDDVRQMYNRIADGYVSFERVSERAFGSRQVRQRLFGQARGRVLDVACGTGANFPHLRAAEAVVGVDLSAGMLVHARRRAEQIGLSVTLQVMDAGRLSFPDASFDTVSSALSTCTFPDPLAALCEMRRVCRPGGTILLFEHGLSRQNWLASLQDQLAGWHYRMAACRWNQEPVELASRAGLRVLRDERHLFGIFHAITATP